MSAPISLLNYPVAAHDSERGHRLRLYALVAAAVTLIAVLAIYGFDYYWLSAADRPLSAKHQLLKPSGRVGIKLGITGLCMFLALFLYPVRKRVAWLRKIGNTKHWLDIHIVLGLTAPVVIAFHASFKFHGIAGVAFWIMFAVALSGIVGRYIYAQIPRSLSSAELSLRELEVQQDGLTSELAAQSLLSAADLAPMLRMPGSQEIADMPAYRALLLMLVLDLARPFHIARLRARSLDWSGRLRSLGGLLSSDNQELEYVIRTARRKSALSKRVTFLSRTQQVFHLWHVIHRPFSYSFAVLAIMHIAVALSLGYI